MGTSTKQRTSPIAFAVANYLRNARGNAGLTQVVLAKRAHITQTSVALIERAERFPRLSTLVMILDALGLSLETMARDLGL